MNPLVVPAFRTQFPEFADTAKYPDQMITFWSNFASTQVRQRAWKNNYLMGVSLYTAHELVLASQSIQTAKVGGNPGTFGGIANTKTVGSATVGYDSATTTETGAGYWNLTNYGKQFYRLAMLYGAGAVQLL